MGKRGTWRTNSLELPLKPTVITPATYIGLHHVYVIVCTYIQVCVWAWVSNARALLLHLAQHTPFLVTQNYELAMFLRQELSFERRASKMVSLRHPSANFCALSPLIYNKRSKWVVFWRVGMVLEVKVELGVDPTSLQPKTTCHKQQDLLKSTHPITMQTNLQGGTLPCVFFKLGKWKIVSFMWVVVPPEHFTNASLLFIMIISLMMQNISNFDGNIM